MVTSLPSSAQCEMCIKFLCEVAGVQFEWVSSVSLRIVDGIWEATPEMLTVSATSDQ